MINQILTTYLTDPKRLHIILNSKEYYGAKVVDDFTAIVTWKCEIKVNNNSIIEIPNVQLVSVRFKIITFDDITDKGDLVQSGDTIESGWKCSLSIGNPPDFPLKPYSAIINFDTEEIQIGFEA